MFSEVRRSAFPTCIRKRGPVLMFNLQMVERSRMTWETLYAQHQIGESESASPRESSKMKPKYAAFAALDPFFEVVQRGLSGLVDGKHYFDTVAENAIFEFRYDIAGWPKRIESRGDLVDLYRAYGNGIVFETRRRTRSASMRRWNDPRARVRGPRTRRR